MRLSFLALVAALAIALPAFAGETKEEHHKKSVAKCKEQIKKQKEKPKSKDDLKKETAANVHKVEVKIEMVVKIVHKIDASPKKDDKAVKDLDAKCKKLEDTLARMKKEEAEAEAFAAHLLEKAWLEALIKELDEEIEAIWADIHLLDALGLHELGDELEHVADELEDVLFALGVDLIELHLDELAADALDALIEWVAELDHWHEKK